MNQTKNVIVLIGAGSIGQAIVKRVGAGKHILIADINQQNLCAAEKSLLESGYNVSIMLVDITSVHSVQSLVAAAVSLGSISGIIVAAGVSPSQAPIEIILKTDLYGTALVLEMFGTVVANGCCGIVISSQSGHRLKSLTEEENRSLAITPAEKLLSLEMLNPDRMKDSLHAYQISKRGNSLRVMAEALRWGKRGARVNAISPGIIMTPLAKDELSGPRGGFYQNMILSSPIGRAGTSDEVAGIAALLMSEQGSFITGSDILMDGGTTAKFWFGDYFK